MKILIDDELQMISVETDKGSETLAFSDPSCFSIVSDAWLKIGWQVKHVYSFSWMGRPIIQLPEDIVRMQELVWSLRPSVIVETGVAHGGSLVFYASILSSLGGGRVVGVDIDIREHNREAIDNHLMSDLITLVEGDSSDPAVTAEVNEIIGQDAERVMVVLDSCHNAEHVYRELESYAHLVDSQGCFVVCDGIMRDVVGLDRTEEDWSYNNPLAAIERFLDSHPDFESFEPPFFFNEGFVEKRVSYWPNAFLRRKTL